jgi:hypothetical protein
LCGEKILPVSGQPEKLKPMVYNMLSDTYKIMNTAIQSTDLLHSGRLLIEFANAVYEEKGRITIVKEFYKRLYQWAFSEYVLEDLTNNEKGNVFICHCCPV